MILDSSFKYNVFSYFLDLICCFCGASEASGVHSASSFGFVGLFACFWFVGKFWLWFGLVVFSVINDKNKASFGFFWVRG